MDKLRKYIREEAKKILKEQNELSANYYLQKFVEKVKNMYLHEIKNNFPRQAGVDVVRNYNGRGNDRYASVEFVAYTKSDLQYNVEFIVVIIDDEVELKIKGTGPQFYDEKVKTFEFYENADRYVDRMVSITKTLLGYNR